MLPIMSLDVSAEARVHLPAFTQPDNFSSLGRGGEQFATLRFTAFMLYLLYFADGPHKTAHYAICTVSWRWA